MLCWGAAAPDEPRPKAMKAKIAMTQMIGLARMASKISKRRRGLPRRDRKRRPSRSGQYFHGCCCDGTLCYSQSQGLITVPKVRYDHPGPRWENYPIPCGHQREVCRGIRRQQPVSHKEIDAAVIASLMVGEDGFNFRRFLLICMLVQLLKL